MYWESFILDLYTAKEAGLDAILIVVTEANEEYSSC